MAILPEIKDVHILVLNIGQFTARTRKVDADTLTYLDRGGYSSGLAGGIRPTSMISSMIFFACFCEKIPQC